MKHNNKLEIKKHANIINNIRTFLNDNNNKNKNNDNNKNETKINGIIKVQP